MDNLRDLAGDVVTGNGDVLYAGWIHSHPADSRHRRGSDPSHSGSAADLIQAISCQRSAIGYQRGKFALIADS